MMEIFYLSRETIHNSQNIKYSKPFYVNKIFPKYLALLIFFFFLFFFKHIYIKKEKIKIDIDNIFKISLFENNIIFSNYSTEIKPIALYYPDLINFNQYFNKIQRIENLSIEETIIKQVDLARSHGIYGFAINYVFSDEEKLYNNILNIFLKNIKINFPFFLNWNNDNFSLLNKIEKKLNNFIKQIKKYLISKNYIKINNKPIISIRNPSTFRNVSETLNLLREKAKENELGEMIIIFPFNNTENRYTQLFDGFFDFSKIEPQEENHKKKLASYYSGIIYKNVLFNNIYNLSDRNNIFRTSYLKIVKKPFKNCLKDFTIEKFYILNNILIKWTKRNLNITNGFIFINSWNNYLEENYLEPDEIYGYATLNCFSKALFNIPFNQKTYQLFIFKDKCIIAVHAHIYYEDLLLEVINKTNNIPVQFDLFLSISFKTQEAILEAIIKKYSKANKYGIKLVENKGRDVLPFITQMKSKIKKYKYFCHIHTKKTKHDMSLGSNWRNYLYENLLGSEEVISEILTDFEKYEKLGFLFPEVYYDIKNLIIIEELPYIYL